MVTAETTEQSEAQSSATPTILQQETRRAIIEYMVAKYIESGGVWHATLRDLTQCLPSGTPTRKNENTAAVRHHTHKLAEHGYIHQHETATRVGGLYPTQKALEEIAGVRVVFEAV